MLVIEDELETSSAMADCFTSLIQEIGEDPLRQGLKKTPQRAAAAMRFLTGGYQEDIEEVINEAIFPSQVEDMIILRDIEFYSLCEHHLLPFFGRCTIGYLPSGKVLGLSKLARLVDIFARRLQIQEELTCQIAECVEEAIGARGVGVTIEASHLCMLMRGVEKQNAKMRTFSMRGEFKINQNVRAEFLQQIS